MSGRDYIVQGVMGVQPHNFGELINVLVVFQDAASGRERTYRLEDIKSEHARLNRQFPWMVEIDEIATARDELASLAETLDLLPDPVS